MVEEISTDTSDSSSLIHIPKAPPLIREQQGRGLCNQFCIPNKTREMWDKLFKDGLGADVHVIAGDGLIIVAHHVVLNVASAVLENMLRESRVKNGIRCLRIPGVPSQALRIFIRFLYSSCYEESELKEFALHLLVLSHAFVVPALKKVCELHLEKGMLTKENVVDVLQLSRLCDAPRLALVCQRFIIKDLKTISASEAWKIMRQSNPVLEQELLELAIDVHSRKQERQKKSEEKKVYLQLHQAMEALLHICHEGCRTIGPRDKALKPSSNPCNFPACKGMETLIRHFYGCKMRVPGGCIHCKRMWQLLELHSQMCDAPNSELCKVPLCQHFKVKKQQQRSKKQEGKWRLLVRRVEAARIAHRFSGSTNMNTKTS